VLPGLESTEDWNAHLDAILLDLAPEGHLETTLAEPRGLAVVEARARGALRARINHHCH
jgi:hypothetical protein